MRRTFWILLVLVSSLLPLRANADDAATTVTVIDASDLYANSYSAHWRASADDSSDWSLAQPYEATLYRQDDLHPIASIDFRDPGALARVSKVRELSLLTLAEVGKARLFFGINKRGLFGFHVGAQPGLGDERCVELARMPYLRHSQDDRP